MKKIVTLVAIALAFPVVAQESASYTLTEHAFNAGGHPSDGVVVVSTSYRITLDAVGGAMTHPNLRSLSYTMNCGWLSGLPPAGEVHGLRFAGGTTLTWDSDPSVGDYNLYRELISQLAGLDYGECEQHAISGPSATDTEVPASGDGFFYLVTAVNRLHEEGTKGWNHDGIERQGTVCP